MPLGVNDYDTARIQERNFADANSFNIVSPQPITDGLILHLDAGNRVSYPVSGTVWYNLSQYGNNGSLVNGPTFSLENGGGIVFDGTDDYINITENSGMTPAILTVEIAFKINSTTNTVAGGAPTTAQTLFFRQNTRTSQFEAYMCIYDETNTRVTFTTSTSAGAQSITSSTNGSVVVGNNYIATFVANTTTTQVYINGSLSNSGSKASGIDYNATHTLKLGRNIAVGQAWDNAFNGSIYSFKIYNRALSAAEVAQNFNATRQRFGI